MKIINLFALLLVSLLVSCGDDDGKLAEKTQVQAQESINAENQNLERRAADLNTDLVKLSCKCWDTLGKRYQFCRL